MNILNKKNIILSIIIVFVFGFFSFSYAQGLKDAFKTGEDSGTVELVARPAGYDVDQGADAANIFIGTLIKAILSIIGVLFLIMMVYGGFLWMTAGGNETQVEKSKKLIIAAIIGTIIVVSSYAISYFIIEQLSQAALLDTLDAS